ncbi:Mobile element protein [Azospirillum melinis]
MAALKAWLEKTPGRIGGRSDTARAVRYMLNRWTASMRHLDDGRLEIDSDAAERGSVGCHAGTQELLVRRSRRRGLPARQDRPHADHKIPRIDELLPWNWTGAADGTGNANVAWLGGRLPGNRQADQRVSGGVIIG